MRFAPKFARALAASVSFIALPAFAQAQDAQPSDEALTTIEDTIVVTAQRRSENTLSVPVAVSVIPSDQLQAIQAGGADTLLSLSGRVPSLYVESTTGRIFPRFYIRGLGNIDFYLGASQPVSVIKDDVVAEHVVLKSNPAFDVAGVEVLKGPQGSLFGRNTTAGIVKFDSVKPTDTFQGRATLSYGSYNTVNAEAGVGGPLLPDGALSFRLSGLWQHRDDWIDNVYTGPSDDGTVPGKDVMGGYDEKNVRLQLLSKPTESLSLLLAGHYRDYEGTASIFYRGSIPKGTRARPVGFDRGIVAYDEAQNNPQAYQTGGASLKAEYDFGGATLTSITAWEHAKGYSRGDTDGGAAANFGGTAPNICAAGCGQSQGRLAGLDQWSQEVRLASPDAGAFKWQLGGIYFDARDTTEFYQRAFFVQNTSLGTTPNPNNWVQLRNINTSWGVFGQASYDLTEALTVSGGLRYTHDKKRTVLLKTANTIANVSTFTGARDVALSDGEVSWDASLLYKLSPNLSLYARAARGFRGPTIQGRSAVFNAPFTTANSETNTSFEAGLKSRLLDDTLRFNLTGFTYTVRDIQLNGNDSNGNGVLFNADKARGYGAEMELTIKPVPNFRTDIGFSLLHTKIVDPAVFAQAGAAGGVLSQTVLNPVVRVGNNYFAQIDGNALPNAPAYNLSVASRWDQPVGNGDTRIFLSGDFVMQGKTYYTLYKSVEYTSDGNFELGMKAGLAFGPYEAAVFVRNLTNRVNLTGVIDTSNYRAGIYNDPRVIGVTLSGSFR